MSPPRKRKKFFGEYVIARDPTKAERKDGWTMAYFEGKRQFEEGLWWTSFIHLAKDYQSPANASRTLRKLREIHWRHGDDVKIFVVKKSDANMEESNE